VVLFSSKTVLQFSLKKKRLLATSSMDDFVPKGTTGAPLLTGTSGTTLMLACYAEGDRANRSMARRLLSLWSPDWYYS